MPDQDLISWLRLSLISVIGPHRAKLLLSHFKSPRAILEAPVDKLAEVDNIGKELALKIVEEGSKADWGRCLDLMERLDVRIIPWDSQEYPVNLREIYDPPLVLFVKGEIIPQDYFSIAVVGTRMASFYGQAMAQKISQGLAEYGITVVSGGARGIDTFSHQACLKAKGRTLAVLGCGLDIVYPPENRELFSQICKNGALISEFPLGVPPDKKNFPRRNRIISGLSLGVVVIEAPQKSGALITVNHALQQGREVFSIPGKVDTFTSKGTNQLLKEGAKLVEDVDDIIEELAPLLQDKVKEFRQGFTDENKKNSDRPGLSVDEARIYNLLAGGPLPFEEIVELVGLPAGLALEVLTSLELRKYIRRAAADTFMQINQ